MRFISTKSNCVTGLAMAAAGTILGACYSHQPQQSTEPAAAARYDIGLKLENISYTASDWPQALRADLYLPANRGQHPVVLTIHGGGWANRSRTDMSAISQKLARRGYAVFNLDYRFAPDYRHPAQIHDLQQALGWILANAARYRLDPKRINTWGYSSGGHLAALLASYDRSHPALDRNAPLPPIRAVVAGGAPSDLRKYESSPIVQRFLGGSLEQMPQGYAEASPITQISIDDPPVFLYHGQLDTLVTQDQASDYYAALRDAGLEAELYLHRWFGHFLMFLFGGDAEDKAIDFLDRINA